MRNVKGNTKKKYDRTKNLVSFTSTRQPSPEAKSKGWEERRQKQKLMDIMAKYGDMSYKKIVELKEKILKNPEKYTLDEVRLANYMSRDKYITDYLDRMGARAKTQLDVTSDDSPLNYTVKIINGNTSNDSSSKDTGSGEGL